MRQATDYRIASSTPATAFGTPTVIADHTTLKDGTLSIDALIGHRQTEPVIQDR
jgi:hypothetical protein